MNQLLADIMEVGRRVGEGRPHSLGRTPWIDETYEKVWSKIEWAYPDLLPVTIEDDPKSVEEWGCGAYGCVSPTRDPNIAVKLTQDVTEAQFVALATQIQWAQGRNQPSSWKPPGIVKYHDIYQLARLRRFNSLRYEVWNEEKTPIFILWREALPTVGPAAGGFTASDSILYYRYGSGRIWMAIRALGAKDRRKILRRAEKLHREVSPRPPFPDSQWERERLAHDMYRAALQMTQDFSHPERAAEAVSEVVMGAWLCIWGLEKAERAGRVPGVVEALWTYLQANVALADLHPGNFGARADGEIAIFDAGHVAMFRTGPSPKIPKL